MVILLFHRRPTGRNPSGHVRTPGSLVTTVGGRSALPPRHAHALTGDTTRRRVAMMNGYGGWGVGAWLMMSLITLVVLALIVAGVVALNRRSHSATPAPLAAGSGGSDALRTLDDRFARGGSRTGSGRRCSPGWGR